MDNFVNLKCWRLSDVDTRNNLGNFEDHVNRYNLTVTPTAKQFQLKFGPNDSPEHNALNDKTVPRRFSDARDNQQKNFSISLPFLMKHNFDETQKFQLSCRPQDGERMRRN